MNILFISPYYFPHVGGVEKYSQRVAEELVRIGFNVRVITSKRGLNLKSRVTINRVKVVRFWYPRIKVLGLLYIWLWFFKNINLLQSSDVVHCHDVFLWYLPFRFIFPFKKAFVTFHGWEGKYPIPLKNILLKKLAWKLSSGTICVGKYIEKYYGVRSNIVTYGAVDTPSEKISKEKNKYVYVGRLSEDTGLFEFLKSIKKKTMDIDFCGDGPLREICELYGKVHGFVDPRPFLSQASVCFVSGYLTILEAFAYRCRVKVAWNNPLKRDYWKLSPMYEFIGDEDIEGAYNWVRTQTWERLTGDYLKLWGIK